MKQPGKIIYENIGKSGSVMKTLTKKLKIAFKTPKIQRQNCDTILSCHSIP
jgi:hypothetical protein